eukprot:Clim_evm2s151 gene=Clim_evmTU2s151
MFCIGPRSDVPDVGDSQSTNGGSDCTDAGLIVGAVCGSVAGVGLLIGGVVYNRRREQKSASPEDSDIEAPPSADNGSGFGSEDQHSVVSGSDDWRSVASGSVGSESLNENDTDSFGEYDEASEGGGIY